MAFRYNDFSMNTIIGHGAAVFGNIHGNGFVRIDGDIDGNFDTNGHVIVGPQARIRGNVTAKSAVIHGVIIGNIVAEENVHLVSTSAIIGDVFTRSLEVDDDVILNGHCMTVSDPLSYSKKPIKMQTINAADPLNTFDL